LLSIGWIEVIQLDTDTPQLTAEVPQEGAGLAQHTDVTIAPTCVLAVTEGRKEGMEGMQEPAGWNTEAAFEELWTAYPAKGRCKRPLSQQYFRDRVRSAQAFQDILSAVKGKWARSEKWAKGFVMALPSWLEQECWREDPEPTAPPVSSGPVYRKWEPPKPPCGGGAETDGTDG